MCLFSPSTPLCQLIFGGPTREKENLSTQVRQQYEDVLAEMRSSGPLTASLSEMTATFLKVIASYFPGLFHCYDVADLPRTNNDLSS